MTMKIANAFFTLSMATYFTIGSYTSIIWTDFYYTVLIGYVLCCIYLDKKQKEDIIVGTLSAGSIWMLYLFRPFIPVIYYDWVRFCFGCIMAMMAILYLIYIISLKIKNRIT